MSTEKESYYVTNREFDQVSSLLGLTSEFIEKIPKNGLVLEVGSGLTQNFSRGLYGLRPDLKIVSLDPTFSLNRNDFVTNVRRDSEGNLKSVYYTNNIYDPNPRYFDAEKTEDFIQIQEERMKEALRSGYVISAGAPNFPFKNESFDLIVETFGPTLYLQKTNDLSKIKEYIISVYNLLKKGGEARIYPALSLNEEIENFGPEFMPILQEDFDLDPSIFLFKTLIESLNLDLEVQFINFNENRYVLHSNQVLMVIKKK